MCAEHEISALVPGVVCAVSTSCPSCLAHVEYDPESHTLKLEQEHEAPVGTDEMDNSPSEHELALQREIEAQPWEDEIQCQSEVQDENESSGTMRVGGGLVSLGGNAMALFQSSLQSF